MTILTNDHADSSVVPRCKHWRRRNLWLFCSSHIVAMEFHEFTVGNPWEISVRMP